MVAKTRKQTRRRPRAPIRVVFCRDAIQWLQTQKAESMDAIVTSIPEMEELGLNFQQYIQFLRTAAQLCMSAVKPTGYVVFLQTDRKYHGWVDKSYHISDVAAAAGLRMVWHKIALRTEPGKTDIFRPTYSHMLCYSKQGPIGTPLPDVVARGTVTYGHAFGRAAVELVCQYLKSRGTKTVVDPFVGSGTTLAVANAMGMNAVGVDIDPAQCRKARHLQHLTMKSA